MYWLTQDKCRWFGECGVSGLPFTKQFIQLEQQVSRRNVFSGLSKNRKLVNPQYALKRCVGPHTLLGVMFYDAWPAFNEASNL